jgi:acetyl-CoA synthetase (ADP-forming)
VVEAVAGDPDVGVILVPLTTIPNYEQSVAALADAILRGGKPGLFVVTPGSVATGVRAIIRERGIAYCDRLDDGFRLIEAWLSYQPGAPPLQKPPALPEPPSLPHSGYLSEPEAKALLAAAGLRVTRERCVRSAAVAVAAAEAIGYPIVLKGVSDRVVHKSDAGLVRLDLADRAAVEAAFAEVSRTLQRLDPSASTCVVAEMVKGGLELILGVKRDPQFGPVVMVGAGGVLVELMGDVEVALAPLSAERAEAMLRRLRIWPLLEGFRGQRRRDIGAVVDALVKLGQLAATLDGRLVELDVNPLLVLHEGEGAIAADARAVVA